MTKLCIICRTEYWPQSWVEPGESCICGQMASGTLWQWNGLRAYLDRSRFLIADILYKIAAFITKPKEN